MLTHLIKHLKTIWHKTENSNLWFAPVLFCAIEYFAGWYRSLHQIPFRLDPFTDVLLIWNQRILHIIIFMMVYSIFNKKWTRRGIGLTFVAVWICTNYALIDIHLHKVLSALHAYPAAILMINGEANSNYAKIGVFLVVLPFFLWRLIKKEGRTMDRILTLLMVGAVLTTTLLFHWLWIEREYHQVLKREMFHIERTLPISEQAFRESCKSSSWECWIGEIPPSRKNNKQLTSLMAQNMIDLTIHEKHGCDVHTCVILSGGFDPNQNEFSPMPLGAYKIDGKWRFIADTSFIANQFLEIRQDLTTLGIVSGSVWIYGILLLWAFHQSRFKKRKSNQFN